MELTPFCLTLFCLRMNPDKSQFYRYDNIILTCQDHWNTTGWTVRRKTPEGGVRTCSSSWGSLSSSSSSSCTVGNIYPTDSGVYWCESADGKTSNAVNITITDRLVLLESPGLPVLEGATVTLRCRAETNSSGLRFDFFKDGLAVSINSTGEMIIHSASKSDEGLYKCSIHEGEESLSNWLAVGASRPPPPSSEASSSNSRLICHLVVGTPYLLSTVLLGLIYRDRKRGQQAALTGVLSGVQLNIETFH
ncbi:Fc receptor-like protein 5 isoform X1 [Sparus aurata]|uniref:Fc receptor-like protein 5 isoform X1 n=1 Tax=Sparus aurata TaxID=8175 RepID=UPI0011C0FC42|nr:Fc receptor-like protein 5 isoform X1 [Sparus aurata]